jgi:hypothetical protein
VARDGDGTEVAYRCPQGTRLAEALERSPDGTALLSDQWGIVALPLPNPGEELPKTFAILTNLTELSPVGVTRTFTRCGLTVELAAVARISGDEPRSRSPR